MPTYSYACTECGNRFDVVQAFTDDALTTCAECNGRLRKIFGKVGVVFKGSGFYRTDNRESGKSSSSSNGNGSGSKTTSPDGGSTDKPAADKPAAPAAKTETAGTAAASS